jgi:hypothetical protein
MEAQFLCAAAPARPGARCLSLPLPVTMQVVMWPSQAVHLRLELAAQSTSLRVQAMKSVVL